MYLHQGPPRDSPVRGSHRDRRSVHVHEQRRRYPEQTIDIHDHRVVLTDEPDNEQGSAPITLFEFTATNQSNKPLLPQLLPRLQSKQLADTSFPTKPPLAHLSMRSPRAKASKAPGRSSSRTPPRPSSSSSTIAPTPGSSAGPPIRSASPSFPMPPPLYPQPGAPHTARHHRRPTAKHIAAHPLALPLVAKTPKQK